MKYELSMCLAGIRPHFWKRVYDTALTSCSRHPFEIVFVGPYEPPAELRGVSNVKHVMEYGSPVRATQVGALHCEGRLIAFPCDDGEFFPDGFNQSIDLHNAVGKPKDGVVLRYREGAGMNAAPFPPEYWNAGYHLSGLCIGAGWKIAPQPMLSLEYYKVLGGVDCLAFECMAYATHDLCYRMQRDGGVFHLSPLEVMNADNYGETGVDHAPIFYGQTTHDHPAFFAMYTDEGVKSRIKIDFDNWKASPEVWERRWGKR